MKNNKFIIRIFIIILLFVSLKYAAFSQESIDPEKKWMEILKNSPLLKNAIELEIESVFPSNEDEKQGRYLNQAWDFTIDKNRNIFIADTKENKIIKLDSNLKYITEIGRTGQGPGEFQRARYIFNDNSGNVYVFDSGSGKVNIFDKDLKYIDAFRIYKRYESFAIDSVGSIFVIYSNRKSDENNLIEVLNKNGELKASYGERVKSENNSMSFNAANIAIDENDNLLVVFKNINKYRKYSTDGKIIIDSKVNNEESDAISKSNMKIMNTKDSKEIINYLNQAICYEKGKIYILRTYPRLSIYEIAETGEILNQYWINTPYKYSAHSIKVRSENGMMKIYVMQLFPENRIEKYKIK